MWNNSKISFNLIFFSEWVFFSHQYILTCEKFSNQLTFQVPEGSFSRAVLIKVLTSRWFVFFTNQWDDYRWVSYNRTIRSAGYFTIETLCYRNSCCLNKFYFKMFSLLCEGLHFKTRPFNFLVSTFWRPEVFVSTRFVASTFYRCDILLLKNKNMHLLYETRAIFSHKLCCRKFYCRRLTWGRSTCG